MNELEFIIEVVGRLPSINVSDIVTVKTEIRRKHRSGWTVEETVRYCRCMEEVNPDLSEDKALNRMKLISDEATARIGTSVVKM